MWVFTDTDRVPPNVKNHLSEVQRREDKTDKVWVNTDNGALIVLACNGGWRNREEAYYELFLYAPGAEPYNITYALLGTHDIRFDPRESGSDSYLAVRQQAVEAVTKRIGAAVFHHYTA